MSSKVRRSVIVIGASGGIGSELCRRLVARGTEVTLLGRNELALRQLGDELDASYQTLDASSFEDVEAALQAVGSVDGVVNCAGSLLLKPAHLTSSEEWQATVSTNLTTAFATVRAASQLMRDRGGSIVLVSSAAARTGMPNHEAIAAAKAGVIGLARSAAATYARRNIRVNVVAPGLTRTPLTKRVWSNDRSAAASASIHALGRLGEPSDVASMIAWLLEEENSWITGQVMGVDGGLATLRPYSS